MPLRCDVGNPVREVVEAKAVRVRNMSTRITLPEVETLAQGNPPGLVTHVRDYELDWTSAKQLANVIADEPSPSHSIDMSAVAPEVFERKLVDRLHHRATSG